ncbi:G-protein coupled receptor GRL101-like [Littorina saxatilis]|uniref:G-protein coupled receptor GRL101-like n=1 Tax=Littorina saxatilis TaxID=31220 RepID=UPI0038B6854C
MRGCPMSQITPNIFKGLESLREVYADNSKLCCPAVLPERFNPRDCHAPWSEISSCDALLRSSAYRVFLAFFAVMAVVGNVSSLLLQVRRHRGSERMSGYTVFVLHLCVSDFLMGVYLAVIGVADRMYLNNYLWEDTAWRHSAGCKVAGFLSLLSNEVSALIICLITLDRFLVVCFPFSVVRFEIFSAQLACGGVWLLGVVLAAVPLLPFSSHWQLYSQTGICMPLPLSRKDFPGHSYSLGVLIIFNLFLFVAIAAGQVAIYSAVTANSMKAQDSSRKQRDMTIARRLITIAATDFLCWFPVGLLGLMASAGIPIAGEVSVAIVVFVLPLNAAINPFLYTLNLFLEDRKRAREAKLLKLLKSKL